MENRKEEFSENKKKIVDTEEELKMIEEHENVEKELMQKNEELADLERILSESDYKIIKSLRKQLNRQRIRI